MNVKCFLVVLLVVSICVAAAAGQWLMDPVTRIVPLSQSLSNHPFFILATVILSKIVFFYIYIDYLISKLNSCFSYYIFVRCT